MYKATDFYAPEYERTLTWNDADVNVDWQLNGEPIVSAKDQRGTFLRDAETFE
jgi:dTDP-4-dehydrorhamnose 3,5-epimerase